MMFKVLIVFAATVYATVAQGDPAPAKRCIDLPLQIIILPRVIVDSPFQVVYSTNAAYACATVIYTTPVPGSNYDIGSTYNSPDGKVLVNLEINMTQPKNQSDTVKFCNDGRNDTHVFLDMGGVDQSLGFCIFTCDNDGVGFSAFKCMSRGGAGLSDSDFTNVLASVKGVPNGPAEGANIQGCPKPKPNTCSYFPG